MHKLSIISVLTAASLSLLVTDARADNRSRVSTFGGDARLGNLVLSTSTKETTQVQRNYQNATVNATKSWVLHGNSQINTTGNLTLNGAVVVFKDFLGGGPGEAGYGPGAGGAGADGTNGDGGGGGGGCGGRGGDGGNGKEGVGGGGGPGIPLAMIAWGGAGGGGGSRHEAQAEADDDGVPLRFYFGGRGRRHHHRTHAYYVIPSGRWHFHRTWLSSCTPPAGDYESDGTSQAGSGPGIVRFVSAGSINLPSTGVLDATGSDGGPANQTGEGGMGGAAGGGAFLFSETGIVLNGLIHLGGGDGGVGLAKGGGGGGGGAGELLCVAPGGRTGSGTATLTGGTGGAGGTSGGFAGANGDNSVENDINGYPTLPLIGQINKYGGFLFTVSRFHAGPDGRYHASTKQAAQMMAAFSGSEQFDGLCHNMLFGPGLNGSIGIEKLGNGDVCDASLTPDRS